MTSLFSVANKVALITGASSGIGKHAAITLARNGADVILVARDSIRLQEVGLECQKYNIKVYCITTDLCAVNSVEYLFEESKKYVEKIDIVLNAAGIGLRVPALEITEAQWDQVMNINVKANFLVAQAAAKWMIEKNTAGSIINISSSAAFHVTASRTAYAASKIAVESITRSLALNFAQNNIRVNCIAPGFFVTSLTEKYLKTERGIKELSEVPLQRAADVKELEGILLLLASNASSYITGSVMHVDGGFCIQKV